MQYFIIDITTQYDGMDWGQKWLIKAINQATALKKAERTNFIHADSGERQEINDIWEITKEEADIIRKVRALSFLEPSRNEE